MKIKPPIRRRASCRAEFAKSLHPGVHHTTPHSSHTDSGSSKDIPEPLQRHYEKRSHRLPQISTLVQPNLLTIKWWPRNHRMAEANEEISPKVDAVDSRSLFVNLLNYAEMHPPLAADAFPVVVAAASGDDDLRMSALASRLGALLSALSIPSMSKLGPFLLPLEAHASASLAFPVI